MTIAALARGGAPSLSLPWNTSLGASFTVGFDALSGPKEFFIAGEENGLRFDYGHMDLVIGERAPEELWPRIDAFLRAHRPGR